MLVVIEPPESGLSTAMLREDGGPRQYWCRVSLLHTERDYSEPSMMLAPGSRAWAHEGRYLSPASLRHLVTGAPREYHGSHDGMTFSPPRPFFQPTDQ